MISLKTALKTLTMGLAALPLASSLPSSSSSLAKRANWDSAGTVRSPPTAYNNTLIPQRADPHIVKHTDGWYYFTASVPAYDQIILRRAETIQGLSSAEEVIIFERKESGPGDGYIWAPELHYLDGKWYVYVALENGPGTFNIRPAVLEGTGDNPLEATWVEKGLVETNWETFSLDMTVFEAAGTRYAVWAQTDPNWGDSGTALLIAPMSNPWTLKLPAVAITYPELDWERIGHNVNEGAYVIKRDGKLFLSYSASATDHNYCLGLLSAPEDGDLMNINTWTKSQEPVFLSDAETSQWGPGHNAFTISEDGQSDVVVFHDRGYRDIQGEPLNNPDRRTRVQKLYWRADGTPDFGIPVPDGWTPVRLRSAGDENLYIRNTGEGKPAVAVNEEDKPPLAETQFRIVDPGLGGQGTVSLELTNLPGRFLIRSEGGAVVAVSDDGTAGFKEDASFTQVKGLSDAKGLSFGVPDTQDYLTVSGSDLAIGAADNAAWATFFTE